MAKFILSREARDDIDEIVDYIALDNVHAAIAVEDDLRDCFRMLSKWKESGRQRPELGKGVRSFPVRRYVVFYSIQKSSVTIIRVIHAARDIEAIFLDDEDL